MKILAAVMDVVFVKKCRYGYIISKVKKFLVYDPTKVVPKVRECYNKDV